ncbi:hypothetical protein KAW38_00990 [Candidatus Micrarchaeota archaeon]|nr:hypothetical protein [Candidatus Micrarchaeota archaeon]
MEEKQIENLDWEELAAIARNLEITFSTEEKETKKIAKSLKMIKQVLYEHLQHPDKMPELSTGFYVKLSKLVPKIEKKLEKYNEEKQEVLKFIRILLIKMRKEKLIVSKRKEKQLEFEKHKEDMR